MEFLKVFGRFPLLIRILYLGLFLAFLFGTVLALMDLDEQARWASTAAGALLVVLGLILVPNLFGTAQTMADAMKTFKPAGADYSKSVFAKPLFLRLFGAGAIIVGTVFVVSSPFTANGGS